MTATPASGPSGAPSPVRSPGIAAFVDGAAAIAVAGIGVPASDGPIDHAAGLTPPVPAAILPPASTDAASQPEGVLR